MLNGSTTGLPCVNLPLSNPYETNDESNKVVRTFARLLQMAEPSRFVFYLLVHIEGRNITLPACPINAICIGFHREAQGLVVGGNIARMPSICGCGLCLVRACQQIAHCCDIINVWLDKNLHGKIRARIVASVNIERFGIAIQCSKLQNIICPLLGTIMARNNVTARFNLSRHAANSVV